MNRYIFIVFGMGLIVLFFFRYIYIKIRTNLYLNSDSDFEENLHAINKNESNLYKANTGLLEYSRDMAADLGFSYSNFKRPQDLKRKDDNLNSMQQKEMTKIKDKLYGEAIKHRIPLEYLYTGGDIKNRTLRVYVESMNGSKVVVRDKTAIKEIDLSKLYDIVGHFVLINIDKQNEDIKINYILKDN